MGINNMTSELTNTIISAIIGAFAGGIVTLLLDKRKERREDKKEKQKEKKKIYEDRPELQIIEYKEYISRPGHKLKKECDINVFMTKMGKVSDEDDLIRFLSDSHASCPYYRNGDEYAVARKQI